MRNIAAIAGRELRAYFVSPVAYVVLTIFVFLSGVFFQVIARQLLETARLYQLQSQQFGGAPPPIDMPGLVSQQFFGTLSIIFLFMLPMITMSLFSEERKRGTIELLLTSPITDVQVILGKFLSAAAFYGIMLLSTLVSMGVLFLYSEPAWGPILTGYVGLTLYGVSLIALGVFLSTLTENQIVAGALTFGATLLLWVVDAFGQGATATTRAILTYLSVLQHMNGFIQGVISTSDVIFYLSMTGMGLFLTYRSIESWRWRG